MKKDNINPTKNIEEQKECLISKAIKNKKDKSLIIDLIKISTNLENHKKEILIYHLEKKKNIEEEEKMLKLLLNLINKKETTFEKTNFKQFKAGNIFYGDQRLELAIFLKNNVLKTLDNHWFIENGTLLGAYRNNKFIDHDDDFDIAILIEEKFEMEIILKKIKSILPNKYDCRLITSYCHKIEVFEPKFGKYFLAKEQYKDSDYGFVTVDLQFYLRNDHDDHYSILYYNLPEVNQYHPDILLPLKEIEVENHLFPCPGNIEGVLTITYGSYHPDAKFNKETGKYHLED